MKELSFYLYTEGKDYPLGCRLFAALKLDPGKHAFFDPQKEEPLRSKMLWRMLSNYARIHNIRPMRPPDESSKLPSSTPPGEEGFSMGKTRVYKHPRIQYDLLSDELKDCFDENAALYNQLRSLHTQLKSLAADAERMQQRKTLATGILELSAKISRNWERIDAFLDAAKQVEEESPSAAEKDVAGSELLQLSELDKDRRIKANLNYIRRYYHNTNKNKEVLQRMQQLQAWGVDYEGLIARITGQL